MTERKRIRVDAGAIAAILLTAGFLLFTAVLLIGNVIPTNRRVDQLRNENRKLAEEMERLEREREVLDLWSEALATDPYTIDRELRRVYGFGSPGDRIVRFEDESEDKLPPPGRAGSFQEGR